MFFNQYYNNIVQNPYAALALLGHYSSVVARLNGPYFGNHDQPKSFCQSKLAFERKEMCFPNILHGIVQRCINSLMGPL